MTVEVGTKFSEEQVERSLTMLALFSGNASRASRELADQGLQISRSTLTAWRDERYAERYQQIHTGLMGQIRERMAQQAEELADRNAEAELAAIERFFEQVHHLSGKDAALAAKNFALARGISTDKALLLRNQPTAIVEHRDPWSIIKRLREKGIVDVIDGTTDEIQARQLADG